MAEPRIETTRLNVSKRRNGVPAGPLLRAAQRSETGVNRADFGLHDGRVVLCGREGAKRNGDGKAVEGCFDGAHGGRVGLGDDEELVAGLDGGDAHLHLARDGDLCGLCGE